MPTEQMPIPIAILLAITPASLRGFFTSCHMRLRRAAASTFGSLFAIRCVFFRNITIVITLNSEPYIKII